MVPAALSHSELARHLSGLTHARHWYVGFSGGVDSTVLLHLLLAWRSQDPGLPPVTAVHVDHGLQAESGAWAAHCQRICDAWRVPLIARRVDTAAYGSGEAAARAARYGAFEQLVGPDDVLLLAHHLDDQVETFFLRLMRGAGVDGLAAMPVSRPLRSGQRRGQEPGYVKDQATGQLLRPLLEVPRSAIEVYAGAHGLAYVEDPSNTDTGFDRNFLRAQVLPLLASRWPGYRESVGRAARHMGATSALLRNALGVPEEALSMMGDPGLPLAQLLSSGEEAAAVMLRGWLASHGYQSPDRASLTEFIRQLATAPVDARPRLELAGGALERYRDALYLLPAMPAREVVELEPGGVLELPGIGRLSLVPAESDGFVLERGEVCRIVWRTGGERLRLRGRGHGSSLKQLLQERGVPPWWRDCIPLVYVGQELLCVGDLAQCESQRWREQPATPGQLWRFEWQRQLPC